MADENPLVESKDAKIPVNLQLDSDIIAQWERIAAEDRRGKAACFAWLIEQETVRRKAPELLSPISPA